VGTFLRLGSETAVVPTKAGCGFISGGGTAVVAAFPGAGPWSSVAGAGATAVQLGIECRHLLLEVFDLLPKGGILREWCNTGERWLGCSLHDAVCAAGCGVHVALGLPCEDGPYIGGQSADPDVANEAVWQVGGEASKLP
jgi:hypothetical protein